MSTVRAEAMKYIKNNGAVMTLSQFDGPISNEGVFISRDEENIAPQLIGLVVDYLVRLEFFNGDVEKAFKPAFQGVVNASIEGVISNGNELIDFYSNTIVYSTDNESIKRACELVTFDTFYKSLDASLSNSETANDLTIEHIKTMVERSINFYTRELIIDAGIEFGEKPKISNTGKIITDKCTGYTADVFDGEADYLTVDGLWDLKVLSNKPDNVDILQLIMYWIMSQHAKNEPTFEDIEIEKIGFYNPRRDEAYLFDIKNIDEKMVRRIEKDIFKYGKSLYEG